MKTDRSFKRFSLSIVWLWLVIFAVLPFCLITIASVLTPDPVSLANFPVTFKNFQLLGQSIYIKIFLKSFMIAGITTLFCLLIGYPFAFIIARATARWKNILLLLVIIPFWTSSLIRSYALIALLKTKGILNSILLALGIIHHPLQLLFTNSAVMIGLIYNLLPFMILPIMTNVERLDHRLVDAARDLGANRFITLRKIIIPLTMPGIIAGCILVFLPAMTLFYIPDILGGAKSILLGNLIQNQFLIAQNWPVGSAISTVLTLILAVLILLYVRVAHSENRRSIL